MTLEDETIHKLTSRIAKAKPFRIATILVSLLIAATVAWYISLPYIIEWASGEGTLVIQKVDSTGPALPLDEDSTRRSAPRLAGLLDQASSQGNAYVEDEDDIRAIQGYLDAEAEASGGTFLNAPPYHSHVIWRGERYYVAVNTG